MLFNLPNWAQETVAAFLVRLRSQRALASNTVAAYQRDLSQFFEYLDARGFDSIESITRRDVRDFLGHLSNEGYARRSVARKTSAIRSFFSDGVRRGVYAASPLTVSLVRRHTPHCLTRSRSGALQRFSMLLMGTSREIFATGRFSKRSTQLACAFRNWRV